MLYFQLKPVRDNMTIFCRPDITNENCWLDPRAYFRPAENVGFSKLCVVKNTLELFFKVEIQQGCSDLGHPPLTLPGGTFFSAPH